jgi:hypothetical protein
MNRNIVLLGSLWLGVVLMSIWIGGTVYQMIVIVPLWTASLPESLRSFMHSTDWGRTVLRFFGPPFMLARLTAIVIALVAGWHSPRHRAPLSVALISYSFIVAFTLLYIYPINTTILAGGVSTVEDTRVILQRFNLADQFRFVIGCVCFLALLWAFRLAVPTAHYQSDATLTHDPPSRSR